jgi:hypothetical protein
MFPRIIVKLGNADLGAFTPCRNDLTKGKKSPQSHCIFRIAPHEKKYFHSKFIVQEKNWFLINNE